MEVCFPGCTKLPKSRLSTAVAGIADEAAVRELLLGTGIQSFRQMAGYIPGKMSLENEPKRMLKDWRSCPFRTRFSEYHVRWVQQVYGLSHYETNVLKWFNGIPWSQANTYQECCHLSSNACGLSRRNKLTFD